MKRKAWYISLLILCIVGIAAFAGRKAVSRFIFRSQADAQSVKDTRISRSIDQLEIESGYSEDGKNRFIVHVTDESNMGEAGRINEDYYSFVESQGVERTVQWGQQWQTTRTYEIYDKFQLNIYSYDGNKLVDTIDLSKTVGDPDFPYYIESYSCDPVIYQGKWCLYMWGYPRTEQAKDLSDAEWEDFYLDIETSEVYQDNTSEKEDFEEVRPEMNEIGWKLNFIYQIKTQPNMGHEVMEPIRFSPIYMYDGKELTACGLVRVNSENLPPEGAELYSEFPDVEKYSGKEGHVVFLILLDIPSNEEYLSYFLSEAEIESIFEDMTLGAEYTVDGQQHDIRSIDDYYMYRYGVHEGDKMPEDFLFEEWR